MEDKSRYRLYRVYTPGPCPTTFQPDIDAAIEWAKQHMPLKRGWTFKVTKVGGNAFVNRFNSKGKLVRGHGVYIEPESMSRRATSRRSPKGLDATVFGR